MPAGRCSGCGHTDSCRKVEVHALSCAAYLELFRTDPKQCLDPAAEQERYLDQEGSRQARADRREVRVSAQIADLQRRQQRQAQRWVRPKDILDD